MSNYENNLEEIKSIILDSSTQIKKTIELSVDIESSLKILIECFTNDRTVYIFGNGGSAADSQHFAAELIGRFKTERRPIKALSLTTDTSIITALSNDYNFDIIFSRQCEAFVKKGDVVIGISTSGNSINVRKGLEMAMKKNAKTIGILGNDGGEIKKIVDVDITVNSTSTAKIQEVHRIIIHILCEMCEKVCGK